MMHIIDPVIYPVKLYLAVVEKGKPQHYPDFTFVKSNIIVSASVSDSSPACVYNEVAVDVDSGKIGVVMAIANDADNGVIVHECYHACEEVFKCLSEDTQVTGEPMAYLLQFFFQKIFEIFNSPCQA